LIERGKSKRISEQDKGLLKRRQAIELIIGHLKSDNRMDRCHLKGETGDKLHAVLCAAGYNSQWLLRMIAKKGVTFLNKLYLRLQKLGCMTALNVLSGLKPNLNRVAWALK
jgi:transposase, IS5 family